QERGQALVADGMRRPQVGRQPFDRGPKGGAGLQPYRDRSHRGRSTVRTLSPMRFHPGDAGFDRWPLELVIPRMPALLVGLPGAPAMRTDLGLGDDDLIGVRMQGPAPTCAAHAGLATRRRPWA